MQYIFWDSNFFFKINHIYFGYPILDPALLPSNTPDIVWDRRFQLFQNSLSLYYTKKFITFLSYEIMGRSI